MTVLIRSKSLASFYEECVLWWMFGFQLTARHIYISQIVSDMGSDRGMKRDEVPILENL